MNRMCSAALRILALLLSINVQKSSSAAAVTTLTSLESSGLGAPLLWKVACEDGENRGEKKKGIRTVRNTQSMQKNYVQVSMHILYNFACEKCTRKELYCI